MIGGRARTNGGGAQAAHGASVGPARLIEIPAVRALSDQAYWLRRCEGFRVVAGSRLLGTVEAVRFERRHDRPDSLIVVGSGPRRRLVHVPVEAIAEIAPDEDLIRLTSDARELPGDRQAGGVLRALARAVSRKRVPAANDGQGRR